MKTAALIMMITTIVSVTTITGYFFVKVLRTKPRKEPDSYCENDDEPR
jgi:hypothetical protein